MAAAFPPQYMAAVMFGNGVSGFGTNVLRAITLLIWPADQSDSNAYTAVLALFIFSAILLAACSLSQVFLRKNAFAIHYLKKIEAKDDMG